MDIGLKDTMKDLFVNFIGAVVFSIIGYFYVKRRGEERENLRRNSFRGESRRKVII